MAALALPAAHVAAQGADRPRGADELVAAGADAYYWHCSVCHGATGGGLAEARLRFPPDEQRCTRCHRPANRAVQSLSDPIVDNDMFSVGDPPPLHPTDARPAALAATAPPEALRAYLQTTMPRYEPGRLSEAEYWALTAYLFELNGRAEELPRVLELSRGDPGAPSTTQPAAPVTAP